MMMRRAVPALICVVLCACSPSKNTGSPPTVGIVQLLEHPDVEDVTKGLRDGLERAGYKEPEDIHIRVVNAQNQLTLLPQLFADLKSSGVDVVVPIFTPTAQAARNEFIGEPIVFAAVTDPVGAGLVINLKQPGGNVTGVRDAWPIARQLELIRTLVPDATKLGVLYNPGEQNSTATLNTITAKAPAFGFTVLPAGVPSVNELLQATSSLAREADVLYTANTISVASGVEAVVGFCQDNDVPFFAGDSAAIKRGAIGTYSQSYYDIGLTAAAVVDSVLRGASPSSIPVITSSAATLYLNPASAAAMGVSIPDKLLANAVVF